MSTDVGTADTTTAGPTGLARAIPGILLLAVIGVVGVVVSVIAGVVCV